MVKLKRRKTKGDSKDSDVETPLQSEPAKSSNSNSNGTSKSKPRQSIGSAEEEEAKSTSSPPRTRTRSEPTRRWIDGHIYGNIPAKSEWNQSLTRRSSRPIGSDDSFPSRRNRKVRRFRKQPPLTAEPPAAQSKSRSRSKRIESDDDASVRTPTHLLPYYW
eukprot:CAMPEP_0194377332 /NCGR_PEP_ID=MMETSP0174-20130528/30299_1 /TAXON_ID=216777 /ORGANISM="Proboscia alata, Strain PI-D3" /LENGTH=160 /DNA_ID=CAMNT_0039158619 /DNA_START=162 /DNA_END=641 /DNA_ORIENTATION=+